MPHRLGPRTLMLAGVHEGPSFARRSDPKQAFRQKVRKRVQKNQNTCATKNALSRVVLHVHAEGRNVSHPRQCIAHPPRAACLAVEHTDATHKPLCPKNKVNWPTQCSGNITSLAAVGAMTGSNNDWRQQRRLSCLRLFTDMGFKLLGLYSGSREAGQ